MGAGPASSVIDPTGGVDTDPRELEAFAERFKQRRIKLGESSALANRNPVRIILLTFFPGVQKSGFDSRDSARPGTRGWRHYLKLWRT